MVTAHLRVDARLIYDNEYNHIFRSVSYADAVNRALAMQMYLPLYLRPCACRYLPIAIALVAVVIVVIVVINGAIVETQYLASLQ